MTTGRHVFLLLLTLSLSHIPSVCFASDVVSNEFAKENNSFESADACSRDEDCHHGGKCSLADHFSEFNQCHCQRGWGGSICENHCPLSCQNNGACRPTLHNSSNYECVCHGEYTGDACEIPFVTCPDHSLCLHGGSCVLENELVQSYSCECPPGFDGSSECTINPNHVPPQTMVERMEEDAIGLEAGMLIAAIALGMAFVLIASVRACQKRRGYTKEITTMKNDMEFTFNPKQYYFDANDLDIEMI